MALRDRQRSPSLDEQRSEEWAQNRRRLLYCLLAFTAVFLFISLVYWWAGKALYFSSTRVRRENVAEFKVWGVVRDAKTAKPVPWAVVEDDPLGAPPFYRTDADQNGAYTLMTLAPTHRLRVSARGYRSKRVIAGRVFLQWRVGGEQNLDVALDPE